MFEGLNVKFFDLCDLYDLLSIWVMKKMIVKYIVRFRVFCKGVVCYIEKYERGVLMCFLMDDDVFLMLFMLMKMELKLFRIFSGFSVGKFIGSLLLVMYLYCSLLWIEGCKFMNKLLKLCMGIKRSKYVLLFVYWSEVWFNVVCMWFKSVWFFW